MGWQRRWVEVNPTSLTKLRAGPLREPLVLALMEQGLLRLGGLKQELLALVKQRRRKSRNVTLCPRAAPVPWGLVAWRRLWLCWRKTQEISRRFRLGLETLRAG